MRRMCRFRVLFVVLLAAAVASAIATALGQKRRLELMDAKERRRYLGDKLGGRISDEQIDRIATAISEKLDTAGATLTAVADDVDDVAEDAQDAVDNIVSEVEESTPDNEEPPTEA